MKNIAVIVLGFIPQTYVVCPKDGVETVVSQLDKLELKYEILSGENLKNKKIYSLFEENKTPNYLELPKIIGIIPEKENSQKYKNYNENKKYIKLKQKLYDSPKINSQRHYRRTDLRSNNLK